MKGTALLAAFVAVSTLLIGCSSSPKMTVAVKTNADTNKGKPFYAVVRSVEQGTYVTDSYEAIAAKVFANPPDPSVLRAEIIYPGSKNEIAVPKTEALPLGVYFLFTSPGERWKVLKPQPLPSTLEIELGANSVSGND